MKIFKKIWTVVTLGALLNLAACAKSDDKKKDKDFTTSSIECTDEVKQDFQGLNDAYQNLQRVYDEKNENEVVPALKEVVSQCNSFEKKHDLTKLSCNLAVGDERHTLEGEGVKNTCDELRGVAGRLQL